MPKIPQSAVDTTFFLFKDRKAAELGKDPGATGFVVAAPSDHGPDFFPHYYAVSCHHAVCSQGYSCIRMNRKSQDNKIFERGPDEWHFDPERGDIAVCRVDIGHDDTLQVAAIPTDLFLGEQDVISQEIGVGEDVFMIGLFIDAAWREGRSRNTPMARFGNISAMPSPGSLFLIEGNGHRKEHFVLDLHSRAGFSGSPVFVFRTPNADFTKPVGQQPMFGGVVFYFLGVHCAQFPEFWEVERGLNRTPAEAAVLIEGGRIKGLSGLTLAAPAWEIAKLLRCERLREQRARLDATCPTPIMLETGGRSAVAIFGR